MPRANTRNSRFARPDFHRQGRPHDTASPGDLLERRLPHRDPRLKHAPADVLLSDARHVKRDVKRPITKAAGEVLAFVVHCSSLLFLCAPAAVGEVDVTKLPPPAQ